MLVLEGTDHVGKTSLAQKLVKALAPEGYVYRHLTRLPDAFHRYWDYLPMMTRKVVMDRFFLSEIAYRRARGENGDTIPVEYLQLLNAQLTMHGGFTVMITCEPDLLASRYANEEGKESQMYKLPVVLAANAAFADITYCSDPSYFTGYHIYLDKDHPWPSQTDLDEILRRYRRLTAVLDVLAHNKPQQTQTLLRAQSGIMN